MAVPRVYKSITDHQKECEFAEWFMKSHRQDLGRALNRVFEQDTRDGETVPDPLPFVDALLTRLRSSLEGLLQAEQRHLDEIGNDAQYRTLRDVTAAPLRRTLIDLRGLFRSSFGADLAQSVGFEREIALDPLALLRQTQRLLDNLRDPNLVLPPSQYEGVTVTLPSIVSQVEPHWQALREAVDAVTRELGEVQGTQVVKDRALVNFRQTYVLFLRIVQGAFRLAGEDELAARLRLAVRRATRGRSGPEEPDDPPADGPPFEDPPSDATAPDGSTDGSGPGSDGDSA